MVKTWITAVVMGKQVMMERGIGAALYTAIAVTAFAVN